jgi:hypothetical protein
MATNIDSVEVLSGDVGIKAGDVVRLVEEETLPECSFLEDMESRARSAIVEHGPNYVLPIKDFWWYGEGSGRDYYAVFLPRVAPCLVGKADLLFFWEGGNGTTGIRVDAGTVTECDVAYVLTPRVPT